VIGKELPRAWLQIIGCYVRNPFKLLPLELKPVMLEFADVHIFYTLGRSKVIFLFLISLIWGSSIVRYVWNHKKRRAVNAGLE